jgi:dolichyl-phosphate-mannose-protein mannosyltransferase
LTKRDVLSIILLSTVFFGIATWNLGYTQTPTTTTTLSDGQSFYVNLGDQTDVGSIYFLLKDGSYNITTYAGSPDNWHLVSNFITYSDYYKWGEIGVHQSTQYIRADFGPSSPNAIIAEVAVSNSSNQQVTISNLTSLDSSGKSLLNLTDEQNEVYMPFTYMTKTYFDEIYFARTAEQYLNLQSPYEWTHPPMGKLIQAAGITVFGFSPFGWRFMGVIFGTLMIPIMYMLGKKLMGSWIGGFASAFLLTFDFMHFTMARMGTADTYVVFFSLLSQLCFVVYFFNLVSKGWKTSVTPLFLAVIFFILGFSTKWLVLYAALGMIALLIALRIKDLSRLKTSIREKYAAFFDHPFLLLIGFIAIAVGIYFAIYIPDMLTGRPLLGTYGNGVIDLQVAMYKYHSELVATHPFSSAWWSWPIMVSPRGYVPLWLDITYLPNNIDSTISAMGNPAIWWVGFACMLLVLERALHLTEGFLFIVRSFRYKLGQIKNKFKPISKTISIIQEIVGINRIGVEHKSRSTDLSAIFIAIIFLFSWIPYVFISRVTFIYHFYVSMPFLCLASAYLINKSWNTRGGKAVTIVFFIAVISMFVLFYPVISGMPASADWIHRLKWFPSWYFAP